MKPLFRAKSISVKLTWLNLLVTGTALLLACLSFLVYDFLSYRDNLIENLLAEAQIAGTNSITALIFNDQQAAQATLDGLRNSPDVVRAILITQSGRIFAEYNRPGTAEQMDLPRMDLHATQSEWTHGSQVLVSYRVVFSGRPVGVVYIQAHFGELGHRVRRYGMIAALILLFCMGAAVLATAAFRRLVTRPIIALAETARVISREKDFSVRASTAADQDEIAVLVEAFNEMLGEIQNRDYALQESRAMLEKRVQERTAELQAANRELEAFSYSVAHDLRGPLDTIGNASYLLRNTDLSNLDGQARELLELLPRTTKRMSALIDDLLNLSRAKSAPLHKEPIDLSALAAAIMQDLAMGDPERQVEVLVSPPRTNVIADQGLMRIVLYNLLCNAWKYTSKATSAHIEFGSMQADGETVFFVRDNGAGFDPRFQDRLFQPFQRLHAQSEFSGTGIGLATVYRIIVRHGGRIWAESELEHGATFFFTLP
jgi:signal transduction histidine kinase